jgi:hypothetical protein
MQGFFLFEATLKSINQPRIKDRFQAPFPCLKQSIQSRKTPCNPSSNASKIRDLDAAMV